MRLRNKNFITCAVLLLSFSSFVVEAANCPSGKKKQTSGSVVAPATPATHPIENIGDYTGSLYEYTGVNVTWSYQWVRKGVLQQADCPISLTRTTVNIATTGANWTWAWKVFSGTISITRSTQTSTAASNITCLTNEIEHSYQAWELQIVETRTGSRRLKALVFGTPQRFVTTRSSGVQAVHLRSGVTCVDI